MVGQKTGLGEVAVIKGIWCKRGNEGGLKSAGYHCFPHHQQAAAHLVGIGHLTQATQSQLSPGYRQCLERDLGDQGATENPGPDKVILHGGIYFASTLLLLVTPKGRDTIFKGLRGK